MKDNKDAIDIAAAEAAAAAEEARRRAEEERRRQQYRALKGSISAIRSKLIEACNMYDSIVYESKVNLLVDNKIVCEEELSKINSWINNIINEIDNNIIPNINNNI